MHDLKQWCFKLILLSLICEEGMAHDLNVHECDSQETAIEHIFSCGSVSGNLRLYSFTNNNAYLVNEKDEDSTSLGGSVTYRTSPYYGVQAAVGIMGQKDLSQANHPVPTQTGDRFGLGEAYLAWSHQQIVLTLGNQKLDLPFLGEWSIFRVMPWLYRGADFKYGSADDFVRITRVTQYKSYVTDEFSKTSRLADDETFTGETKGMLAVGAGKKVNLGSDWFKTQFWYEHYYDINDIYYLDAQYNHQQLAWNPVFAVQGIYSKESGSAHLGKIENKTLGAQVVLQPQANLSWQIGYNKIFENDGVYKNGALVTPYAHAVTSTPIYAQSFLSSTQDFGAGQAFSSQISSKINDQLSLGGRYAFIKMRATPEVKFNHLSEYLIFGTYRFPGKLKGVSISNYFAIQTKPSASKDYIHNRLMLAYDF